MSRILLVGVELEGGWLGEGEDDEVFPNEPNTRLLKDQSLPGEILIPPHQPCPHVGEIVSPPLPRERVESWMLTHYPDAIQLSMHQDGSQGCGLHVHASLKDVKDYVLLGSWTFYHFFLTELEKKAAKWNNLEEQDHLTMRLAGRNKYCRRTLQATKQLMLKKKGVNTECRRTQLNFSYNIYETIECRVLPMFKKAEHAVEWVHYVLDIYERFLENLPPDVERSLLYSEKVISI